MTIKRGMSVPLAVVTVRRAGWKTILGDFYTKA